MTTWRVYLGSRASIWAHRGYRLSGDAVICDSQEDAERVLSETLDADSLVAVEANDGTYYYESQEDADSDQDGSRAEAVIRPPDPMRRER